MSSTKSDSVFLFVGKEVEHSNDRCRTFHKLQSQNLEYYNPEKGVKNLYISQTHPDYIILSGFDKVIWTSLDRGDSFIARSLFFDAHHIKFNPVDPYYLLAFAENLKNCELSNCTYTIYISLDFGGTWREINKNILDAEWRDVDETKLESVVYLDDMTNLYQYHLRNYQTEKLISNVLKLDVSWNYIIVKVFESDPLNWTIKTKLENEPFVQTNLNYNNTRTYQILEASEFGIILIELSNKSSGNFNDYQGKMWKSDSKGSKFSLSLNGIFVFPDENPILDIQKIFSLEGTYMASFSLKNSLLYSQISWTGGSTWNNIKTQEDIEGITKNNLAFYGPFKSYASESHFGFYSEVSAPGSILVVGKQNVTIFDYISKKIDGDVYLSRNGGYTFKKILDKPHFCQFLNEGSIIFCVPGGITNKFLYSLDQGTSWKENIFISSDIRVKTIDSEDGYGLSAVIIGTDEALPNKTILVSFDLRELDLPDCLDSDYETWRPSDGRLNGRCILGREYQYHRPKAGSSCRSNRNKDTTEVIRCACQAEDFECDIDYFRNQLGKCELEIGKEPVYTQCIHGIKNKTSGYRKLAGNICDGELSESISLDTPISEPCDIESLEDYKRRSLIIGIGVSVPLIVIAIISTLSALWYRHKLKYKTYHKASTDENELEVFNSSQKNT